jgi:hypothetical protein
MYRPKTTQFLVRMLLPTRPASGSARVARHRLQRDLARRHRRRAHQSHSAATCQPVLALLSGQAATCESQSALLHALLLETQP